MLSFRANKVSVFGPTVPIAIGSVWDGGYRYGFNGKELDKDEEGMGGGGSTYDYGFRIYNPNLGKFLSVDPLSASYPWYTPYQFAGNKPIQCIDLDGLEEISVVETSPRSNFVVNATVTITMTYMQVTSGNGAVHSLIDASKFNQKYKLGNQKILMAQLPGPNTEPIALEGKALRLGEKALGGNKRAIRKLKKMGYANIFLADVQFNYTIIQSPNTTLDAALTWMNENKQGRGIIVEQIPNELMKNSYGTNFATIMRQANESFSDPDVGGIASNQSYHRFIDNYVILPKFTTMRTSATDRTVHEAGHNAAYNHLHGNGIYEYYFQGLENNGYKATNDPNADQPFNNGKDCYPSKENIMNILKDASNRGATSATLILIKT